MTLEIPWDELKTAILAKPNNMQYVEFASGYTVALVDGSFTCFCKIVKNDPVEDPSPQKDFEDNFKASGNKAVDKGNPANKYLLHEIDEAGTTTYIGMMDNMGVWLIKRLVETGTDATLTYANISNNGGETTFAAAWAVRATTFTYDTVDNLTGV